MSTSTQVAVASKSKAPTIRERLEGIEFKRAVQAVLPKHLTPERFLRVAILAITRTPKLSQCDQASFFNALLTLSQLGLEPDGRRAHLIPFENRKRQCTECQLIVDWKGLAELAMRSGIVANLHADVVFTGDEFGYSAGKIRSHVPWFLRRDAGKPESRGEMLAAYAIAEFKDGTTKAEVLSLEDVESVRARSRVKDSGPWVTDFSEMAKKTAFRRLSKWLPLSPEFRDAVEADDELPAIQAQAIVTSVTMREPSFELPPPTDSLEADPDPQQTQQQPQESRGEVGQKRSHLDVIRRRLSLEGIEEGKAVEKIHSMFAETGGCNTLGEVETMFPNVINAISRSLPSFLNQLQGGTATQDGGAN